MVLSVKPDQPACIAPTLTSTGEILGLGGSPAAD